jgi:alcohol dehydrogenase
MRGVLIEEFGKVPVVANLPDPTPAPGGAVIRVEASGICRSDWHGWMGHDRSIALPHVPGHELAGTVVAVGRDVRRWKEGDRVTLPFVAGCGHCEQCGQGQQQVCPNQFQPGFSAWGSFAEYVAIDYADVNLVRLPGELDFAVAASLGCRFATAFHALADQAALKPGQWFVVHGCGGVGLSAIIIAAGMGAKVVAVDISDEKLDLARKLGASRVINALREPSLISALEDATEGGAQVSMDALGSTTTLANSVNCLRRRGVHLQVGLMLGAHANPAIPMGKIVEQEIAVLGCHGIQAHRYPDMLEFALDRRTDLSAMIGARVDLQAAPKLLAEMDEAAPLGISVIVQF